ncbi:sugar kinase [Streptomyces sp. MAR25Y5]|uniref:sugar kinase n=1 Tax=Streptomyces sp. MAR25Y5 TaxID=2962028 RepID=UPI0020B668CA|nr:sugar kinase [Streptomyces sp. MAR25Y5]MCP3766723.1 sugar kinase [Streptomyces sp. MAR25Y5]
MTATGPRTAPDAVETVDVVALGESMVTFLPSRPGPLADVPSFERAIGGAESNTACVLAAAGHSARWVGAVGRDGFGDHLLRTIGEYGVDVSSVRRDPHRPTGVYFRTAGDRATDAHEVAYYRAGSAASAMTTANVDLEAVHAGRVLHLSGITAALSDGCLDLVRELTARRPGRPLVSFDVNHRPGLWRDGGAHGPEVLLELARGADLVLVGDDEAREAWGLADAAAVREALPEPEILVVKHGGRGATAYGPDGARTFVPSLGVDVVAAVGAGDAFAAGFLSATLRALPVRDRLRHGHLMAAAALTVPGDLAAPPARDLADRLAALDDTAWGRLRLGPGWTETATAGAHTDAGADRAEEEVRTP